MGILIGLIGFFVMLLIVVIVHELGHMLTALYFKVPVEEFGIGYPPRAMKIGTHRGVVYSLNWLPIGGFVRFAKTLSDESGEKPIHGEGALSLAPPLHRIAILASGPIMNIVLAIVIYTGVIWYQGVGTATGAYTIASVPANSPAYGILLPGDVLLAAQGNGDTIADAIAKAKGNVELRVQRDGTEIDVMVEPRTWQTDNGNSQFGIGIYYRPETIYQKVGLPEAFRLALVNCGNAIGDTLHGLRTIIAGVITMQPAGANMVGPVGLVGMTQQVIDQSGFVGLLLLAAFLSLNLAVINLLPFPALDGSHILFAAIEWLRGGKRLSPERESLIHAAGFTALLMLMIVVSFQDIGRLFQ